MQPALRLSLTQMKPGSSTEVVSQYEDVLQLARFDTWEGFMRLGIREKIWIREYLPRGLGLPGSADVDVRLEYSLPGCRRHGHSDHHHLMLSEDVMGKIHELVCEGKMMMRAVHVVWREHHGGSLRELHEEVDEGVGGVKDGLNENGLGMVFHAQNAQIQSQELRQELVLDAWKELTLVAAGQCLCA